MKDHLDQLVDACELVAGEPAVAETMLERMAKLEDILKPKEGGGESPLRANLAALRQLPDEAWRRFPRRC